MKPEQKLGLIKRAKFQVNQLRGRIDHYGSLNKQDHDALNRLDSLLTSLATAEGGDDASSSLSGEASRHQQLSESSAKDVYARRAAAVSQARVSEQS